MKTHLPLIVPAAAGVLLILLTSLVQGFLTDRWAPTHSEDLEKFANAMAAVRRERIGDWDVQQTTEMDPREREAAGAVGDLSLTYRNPHTQEVVSVYLICGLSRNVAIHTPDACYVGSGFRMEDKIRPYTIPFGETTAEFRTATFLKEDATSTQTLRVFWAWNAEGTWEAPEMPRIRFGGRTPLNKLYLITRAPSAEPIEESPAIAFARDFLPVVTALLFSDRAAELKLRAPASKGKAPAKKPADRPASPEATAPEPAAGLKPEDAG